jgi:hypothetical protein
MIPKLPRIRTFLLGDCFGERSRHVLGEPQSSAAIKPTVRPEGYRWIRRIA